MAHWALAQGWAEGDVVALYMESQPSLVALWLGLAMVGVEAAFINYNLRQQSLLHCVSVSGARAMVFGTEMRKGRGNCCRIKRSNHGCSWIAGDTDRQIMRSGFKFYALQLSDTF